MTKQRYEYRREYPSRYGRTMEECPESDTLKRMGQEGWELCAVSSNDSAGNHVLYFKRALSSECPTCLLTGEHDPRCPNKPSAPLDTGERAAVKAFANSPRRVSPTVDGSNVTDELIRRLRKENELLHRALAQGRTDLTDEALGQQIRALAGSAEKSKADDYPVITINQTPGTNS